MADKVVSVRIPEKSLRQLQFLAGIYDMPVGVLIRNGVNKYIFELVNQPGFKQKAEEMKRRHQETLHELLPESSKKPRRKKTK